MSKLTSTNRSLVLLLFAYPLRLCAQKGTPRYARVSAGKTFNPYSQHAQPVQVRSQLLRIGEMQRMQAGVAVDRPASCATGHRPAATGCDWGCMASAEHYRRWQPVALAPDSASVTTM